MNNEPETDINVMQRLRGSGLPRQAVLELNPKHPLIQRLNRRQDDARLADWVHVLFSQAVLTLGARIEDPTTFVSRLNGLLTALTEEGTDVTEDGRTGEGGVRTDGQMDYQGADGTDHEEDG